MERHSGHPASEVHRLLRSQHATVTRAQALGAGVTDHFIRARLADGSWTACHRGVYRLTGVTPSAYQALMAAVLAIGPPAAASHHSAAWLWGLLDTDPGLPAVTVASDRKPTRQHARIYRSSDLEPERIRLRHQVPCTDPLRTLIDVGAVAAAGEESSIHDLIDRALSRRLVTVEGLVAEAGRLGQRGRRGPSALLAALRHRGFVGAPDPSVLESQLLRLLRRHGIGPAGVEVVVGATNQYRVDVLVAPGVLVEVDGYAYHWSPEDKQRDEQRRNRIRLDGNTLLVFTWLDIARQTEVVVSQILEAMARGPNGATRPAGRTNSLRVSLAPAG